MHYNRQCSTQCAVDHQGREREILLELKFDGREGSSEMQVTLADLKQKLLALCAVRLCCTTGVGFECCSSREERAQNSSGAEIR